MNEGVTLRFLSVEDVLAIHEDTIGHEGGRGGVRDRGLLESAVMMPRQRFGGRYLHEGLAAMAAAYLFHIVADHPFVDGSKRTGALAALVFLDVNGARSLPPARAMEATTLGVAAGRTAKEALTAWIRRHVGG